MYMFNIYFFNRVVTFGAGSFEHSCFVFGRYRFISRAGDQIPWLWIFVDFLSTSRLIPLLYLKLGHDRFFPRPLQFIIHLPTFYSTLLILLLTKRRQINYKQRNFPIFSNSLSQPSVHSSMFEKTSLNKSKSVTAALVKDIRQWWKSQRCE
jgi:hypothetical protein